MFRLTACCVGIAPGFEELVIRHARIGYNHVAALGNPRVVAANGVVDQYIHLQHACRRAGVSLACFILYGQQYLFYDGSGSMRGVADLEVSICRFQNLC